MSPFYEFTNKENAITPLNYYNGVIYKDAIELKSNKLMLKSNHSFTYLTYLTTVQKSKCRFYY